MVRNVVSQVSRDRYSRCGSLYRSGGHRIGGEIYRLAAAKEQRDPMHMPKGDTVSKKGGM